jgi:hypothetical protein
VSAFLSEQLTVAGALDVIRIIREDEAIQHAASIAKEGDVVVHIVNDDIQRSVNWLRDYFKADFA